MVTVTGLRDWIISFCRHGGKKIIVGIDNHSLFYFFIFQIRKIQQTTDQEHIVVTAPRAIPGRRAILARHPWPACHPCSPSLALMPWVTIPCRPKNGREASAILTENKDHEACQHCHIQSIETSLEYSMRTRLEFVNFVSFLPKILVSFYYSERRRRGG